VTLQPHVLGPVADAMEQVPATLEGQRGRTSDVAPVGSTKRLLGCKPLRYEVRWIVAARGHPHGKLAAK
jgi:hypothetical protein